VKGYAVIGFSRFRKMSLFIFLLLVVGLVIPGPQRVYGDTGALKYFKNYNPIENEMQPQNWNILLERRGFIYAANQGGLLQYDGVSWRIIKIPNQTARSLAIDEKGTVYVGGRNEFGFLAAGANGSLQYVSLLKYADDKKRNFGNVWKTHSTKEGVYFCTYKFLFRWNSHTGQLKVWEPASGFSSTSFTCKGTLFIRLIKVGLVKMEKDSLVLVPGGEIFEEKSICMVAPYEPGSQKLLIGTPSTGLLLHDGRAAAPFPTEADDYLKKNSLYYGTRLSSSLAEASSCQFALATRLGGLVIIDSRGHLKNIFNKDSGLRDDNVRYVFEDSPGNLWLGLNDGITKIEYASPIFIYDAEGSNLPGIVLSVTRHGRNKSIYSGTTVGLYSLTPTGKFRPVPGITGMCWSLLSHDDWLFVATSLGVFLVKKSVVTRIVENNSYILSRSGVDTNRIWVGTARGLTSLYLKEKKRIEKHTFADITMGVRTIVEEKKGNLWLGTLDSGVLKVDFPVDGKLENSTVTAYGTEQGLPTGELHVFMAADHVMIASQKGIFRFDESNKTFVPDTTLGAEFAGGPDGKWMFRIAEDKNKNIWFHSLRKNYQAIPQPDGAFHIIKKPFLRIPMMQVNWIYPDPDGFNTWFAAHKGLMRYDTRVKKDYLRRFPVFIRRVLVNGSPVFAGYRSGNGKQKHFPVILYRDRNLRFEYAAPFFENEAGTLYSSRLEGYEDHWSPWTRETKKDYTNLDAGVYTFHIRAKNIYEQVSTQDTFRFNVLPPWYQTWWAFSLYVLAFFFIVFLMIKWRSRKLVQDKKQLEQIVKTRTAEVYEKNLLLEEQSEKLKEMDKVKSRFFANISHEFRTPLTLIMGPLEQMLPGCREEKQKKQLTMMLRNSQRLLALINQLLELSKFDSGKVKLQAARQNIIPFLKGIVGSFEIAATANELDLTFQPGDEEIELYMDPEKIENVMGNLLVNALKFTPAGGKITVSVKKNPGKEKNFPLGSLEITVCDTGPGIPREQLANIFDRFYQADTPHEHLQKGSGIGLAIAKELVELHHGTIDVHSREGLDSGTGFIIRLPLGDAHLGPGEIVERLGPPSHGKISGEISPFEQQENDTEEMEADEGTDNEAGMDIEMYGKDIILVVEDSADVREYIKGALEPAYRVVEAADGREGIEKAGEIIPDLIISDIMMPEADGYELCRALKNQRDTSHIPIILLTAKAAEENIIEGLETGADDYITKPFNTKILRARIKNLVALRHHWQETIHREMTLKPVQKSVSQMDKEFVKDLQEVINQNLADPEFNVEELCKRLYMGRTTLYRKILALTGEPPTEFIRSYRLKRGAELLERGMGSVLEVAFEVGFSSANYFSKCFKKKFHRLPSSFQASEAKKE
jgi:signal transduction histidine kinase/DNA-binding NarL/FixJ family response regulator